MQFEALFMALLIVVPSRNAAAAMPVPTIARMSAYSAAAAPDSSFHRFMIILVTEFPPLFAETSLDDVITIPKPLVGTAGLLRSHHPILGQRVFVGTAQSRSRTGSIWGITISEGMLPNGPVRNNT